MTEIIKFIRDQFERELGGGRSLAEAGTNVEIAVRTTFAGERVYIAGYPKQARAVQLAKLQHLKTLDMALATGITVRRVRQIMRGK